MNKQLKYSPVAVIILLMIGFSCTQSSELEAWEAWKKERLRSLKEPQGFVNLAGLFWLDSGVNKIGSSGDILFPNDMPADLGELVWRGDEVIYRSVSDDVTVDSTSVTDSVVVYSAGNPKMMRWGSYVWYIIDRVGNIGVRLKNLNHPNLKKDIQLTYFDYNPELVVEATFMPYKQKKELRIDNVLGHEYQMEISGQLQFEIDGQPYTLEPIDEGEEFFIIFSDETSAIETYGSGRYMYADMPKGKGDKVLLDFNRCYNPPCAFTDFATCFIPPRENRLDLPIEAGELDYHMH
ncbi:MAG: DUF1684 domain-containing protein [Cyclobacteriaceae bacterium]